MVTENGTCRGRLLQDGLSSLGPALVIQSANDGTRIALFKGDDCAIGLDANLIAAIIGLSGLSGPINRNNGSILPVVLSAAIKRGFTNAAPLDISTNGRFSRAG